MRDGDGMDAEAVLAAWHDRSGEFSPGYYAYYGPNETSERIRRTLDATLDRDAAVLELGCSSGRHLSHLADHGYRDLTGIEINEEARAVMESAFPDLAATGTFHFDAIEDVIADFDDGQFDAVYAVETLQHIHPDNDWVFEEIARVTDDVLVTVEIESPTNPQGPADVDVNYVNEDFPLYYRNWDRVFSALGFTEVDVERLDRDTLRVFRRD